jgi:hypothetical protein
MKNATQKAGMLTEDELHMIEESIVDYIDDL